ncbi:MAG: prepilin peptidase, partial [Ferrovum sp.]|nr:prepilin peptidase [Ferrovum sp.]
YWIFRAATGREGLGRGDFKLLAAVGAWLGLADVPVVLMGSALLGVVGSGVLGWWGRKGTLPRVVPFGPFISLAACGVLWFNLHGRGL